MIISYNLTIHINWLCVHLFVYLEFYFTFAKYFADKIPKLKSGLSSTDADPPVPGSYKHQFIAF